MHVVSGLSGHEKIHFEAPLAPRLKVEMNSSLHWLEFTLNLDYIIHAAVAHLWFATLHPL
jgi:Fic family protein